MMNSEISMQSAFDYSVVDGESAKRLQEIGKKIRILDAVACVQIGSELAEAQKLLNRQGVKGEGFQRWVASETPYGKQAAYDLINIHKKFTPDNFVQLIGQGFSQTIIARLAAPSTPDSVIEKAREVAESGGALTVAQVEEMKRQAKAEVEAELERERQARIDAEAKLAAEKRRTNESQQESNKRLREIKEKNQLLQSAQAESARLRNSIASEAEKLASASLIELQNKMDNLLLDKQELEDKIQSLRKEQDAAAETKAKQLIQAQQDEINRREAQLRAIEGRIETLNQRLIKVDQQDAVVAHFEQAAREIRATLNTLGHQIQVALDEEDAPFLPAPFVPTFEKLAEQLEQGAAGVRGFLANVDIRQLEVLTHG